MKTLMIIVLFMGLSGCTNSGNATDALEGAGYRDVKITGYRFFGCAKDDTVHTGFEAMGQNGKRVSGTVCGGVIFKNATIRLD